MTISRLALVSVALAGCTFRAPDAATDGSVDGPPDGPIDTPGIDTGGRVVDSHLIGMWRFAEGSGLVARDTTAALRPGYTQTPMDLVFESPTGFQWSGTDGLLINGPVQIRTGTGSSARPHMTTDVNTSGGITLELWVTPADVLQGGVLPPATLFTLGSGQANCSVRLTQAGTGYVGCAKTALTARGPERPLMALLSAKVAVQHLVLVADSATRALYVDGVEYPASAFDVAMMANWVDNFRISLGDEVAGGAPWRGHIWLAAVYDRALTAAEVRQNFTAGHKCSAC